MTETRQLEKYSMNKSDVVYTLEDNKTWRLLFNRQLKLVGDFPCKEWKDGFKRLNLDPKKVPDLEETGEKINKFTGWNIMNAKNEFLNNEEWFTALLKKEFPATNFIRKLKELDFTPYPDLFHEYFGHLPLMTIPIVAEITHLFGKAFFASPEHLRVGVGRLWWHTMEWSFIKEGNKIKAFGAGLIAGKSDLLDGISKEKIPFTFEEAFTSLKTLNDVQEKYFLLNSLEELKETLEWYIKSVKNKTMKTPKNFDPTDEIEEFRKDRK